MQHPVWFTDFISRKRLDHFIDIDQGKVHYQSWGESDKPGLLFVHGHAAHSHWWDFIAPAFLEQYHVAAMDMSGYGDSDHRKQYSAAGFAGEILAVAERLGQHTTVVGHSFGGAMTRVAAYLHGDQLGAIVLVDSIISGVKGTRKTPTMPKQKSHFYPTIDSGMRRFRLRPPQSCDNRYLLDYIAEHSLKQTNHGFEFKLDQSVFARMVEDPAVDLPDAVTMIRSITCPVAFIYGGKSRFFNNENTRLIDSLFNSDCLLCIEDAHHHVFLDQPLEFIQALKTVLKY